MNLEYYFTPPLILLHRAFTSTISNGSWTVYVWRNRSGRGARETYERRFLAGYIKVFVAATKRFKAHSHVRYHKYRVSVVILFIILRNFCEFNFAVEKGKNCIFHQELIFWFLSESNYIISNKQTVFGKRLEGVWKTVEYDRQENITFHYSNTSMHCVNPFPPTIL